MEHKEPKFTGHKKGKAELWLGEPTLDGAVGRIRMRTPDGKWHWANAHTNLGFHPNPCWLYDRPQRTAIARMKSYDASWARKTIFLGYF